MYALRLNNETLYFAALQQQLYAGTTEVVSFLTCIHGRFLIRLCKWLRMMIEHTPKL